MLTPNQLLDMRPIGMLVRIRKTKVETNGQSLEMEWELLPKADGTPVHVHPTADETYQILEGQLELNINGRWIRAQQGDQITVPAGTSHTFRNPTDDTVRVYNTHSPALEFGEYFEGLNQIVAKLSKGGNHPLSMNLNAATHLSMLMKKYHREMQPVDPPRLIVSLLNWIGMLRGIRL